MCRCLCFWGKRSPWRLGKNRVWSDGLHVGLGFTSWSQGSGAALRRDPGASPLLLWLFLDRGFEQATVIYFVVFRNTVGILCPRPSYLHTSWRLYFKRLTLKNPKQKIRICENDGGRERRGVLNIHATTFVLYIPTSKWFSLKNECDIHLLHGQIHVVDRRKETEFVEWPLSSVTSLSLHNNCILQIALFLFSRWGIEAERSHN